MDPCNTMQYEIIVHNTVCLALESDARSDPPADNFLTGDHLNHSASRSRGHMRESGKRRPRSPLKPEQYKGALAVNPEVFSHVNSWLLDISNRADASVSSQDKQRAGEQTLHSGESDAEVSRTPDESPILLIPEVTHHSPHPKVDGGAAYGSETTTESSKVSSSHMASILAHQKPVEAHKHGAASSVLNTLVDVPQSDTDSLVLDTTPIDLRPFLKVHSLPNQAVLPAAEDKTRRSMQESVSKSPVQLESITRASSGPSTLSSVPSHPVGPSVKHQKISPGKSSSQFSDSSGSKLGLLRDPYSILLGIAAVTPHRLQTGVQDKTTKVSDGSSDSPLHLPATLEAARHSKASTESITASSTSASSLDRSLHSSVSCAHHSMHDSPRPQSADCLSSLPGSTEPNLP